MALLTKKKRLVCVMAALGGVVLTCALVGADETIRLTQNIRGDSKTIILNADEIATWIEGGRRVILMRGNVLVEHGVVHGRMKGAVAWVDPEQTRRTGIMHLELYAEGDVGLENGPQSQSCQKAFLDLYTRGALKLNAHERKVIQVPHPEDPIYQRGQAEHSRLSGAPTTPPAAALGVRPVLQQTSYDEQAPDDHSTQRNPAGIPVQSSVPPSPGPQPGMPPTFFPAPTPMTPPSTPLPIDPGPAPTDPGPAPPGAGGLPPPTGPSATTPPASAPGPPGPQAQTTPPPAGPERQVRIVPRTSGHFEEQTVTLPNGEQAIIFTGGIILTVRNPGQGIGLVDIEADRLVVWSKGNFQQLLANLKGQGQRTRELEFYMAGNVEMREQTGPESRKLTAEEVYYDVGRNVAIAYKADLEFKQPGLIDPIHLQAERVERLSETQFRAVHAEVFSSRLPSDPGLKIYVSQGTIDEKKVPKRSIFGFQYYDSKTGQPETEEQRIFRGRNMFVKADDIPFFYFPYIQGDADNPLGPLKDFHYGSNSIFGVQLFFTFNFYDLLAMDPIPGTQWDLFIDYMTYRGPALGSDYNYGIKDPFGLPGKLNGVAKVYGIDDTGRDNLGGGRGPFDDHPTLRGRFLWRQNWELPLDFTLQSQVALLSDHNFLEQYFKNEYDTDYNQETFAYLKQQRNQWSWSVLAEPHVREWVTETEWLPRADGYLIGQSFFELLTYNAHASAGYAQLQVAQGKGVAPPIEVTDKNTNTGRLDYWNELSLPFSLGPVRLVPYVVGDITYYSQDLTGNDNARLYEAFGLRGSMPLTRLYPDVQSDFLNLNAINHKIVFSGNYFWAHSDTPYTMLPQLDRLNDDATDQSLRDVKPFEPVFISGPTGLKLATSPLYDPQTFAIRQLVEDRIDTLDSVEVLQMDVRQRLQTKRGYPGNQHTVDWMTLDLSGSWFPDPNRDNFKGDFAFLQYDYTWNIGDRTALVSTGWVDPFEDGIRMYTLGAFFNRPDRTSYYVGYRQIPLLQSQLVTAAATYVFSPKYAGTASVNYDFGTSFHNTSSSVVLTRMGSDLQISAGISFNSLNNNVGFVFEIVPNLLPSNNHGVGVSSVGTSLAGR